MLSQVFSRFLGPAVMAGLIVSGIGLVPAAGQPLQPLASIEVRVPFEPTAFPNNGNSYLFYELYLTNYSAAPVTLQRLEVYDPGALGHGSIEKWDGPRLGGIIKHAANIPNGDAEARNRLAPGEGVMLFMMIKIPEGRPVPARLKHRIVTTGFTLETALIGTSTTPLPVLGRPLQSGTWKAGVGPDNDTDHRRGVLFFGGKPTDSRRYAFDWTRMESGAAFSGDENQNSSYFGYGTPVLAVADGIVSMVQDDVPSNVPGSRPKLGSLAAICGNFVALDLRNDQSALFLHLQPGSLRVKVGDRVKKGAVIGLVGNTGDSKSPHLHFQLVTGFDAGGGNAIPCAAGEGIPFVFESYRAPTADRNELHRRELPLNGETVNFGTDR